MNPPRPSLTERTAAIAYARAFNTHDPSLLAPLIHDELRVSDQLRWHHLVGGENFLSLIGSHFQCAPSSPARNWMEIATLPDAPRSPFRPRPCVVEYRNGKPACTILFRVHDGAICFIERRLLPPPTECRLSGNCPGLEDQLREAVN